MQTNNREESQKAITIHTTSEHDETEVEEDEEDEDEDINIADVMNIRGEGGITVVEFGDGSEDGAVETVIGGLGEEYGGCVDNPSLEDEDSEDEDLPVSSCFVPSMKQIMRRKKKKICPFDEITGEISEAYLKANPNTLKSKRIVAQRQQRLKALMDSVPEMDQFVVESFVHTYHGYEIAKRWCQAHPDKIIEFMDECGSIQKFTSDIHESDLPHWRRYCSFSAMYLGEEDERIKRTEPPRIDGAFTRREREERERKRPWYQNPNSLRPEDRICVLKTLDKMIVKAYVTMMDSIEDL